MRSSPLVTVTCMAIRALMLVNEQLEQRLERISAHMDDYSPYRLLH